MYLKSGWQEERFVSCLMPRKRDCADDIATIRGELSYDLENELLTAIVTHLITKYGFEPQEVIASMHLI